MQIDTDSDLTMIDAGGAHNIAVKSNGFLWAWGLNSMGQLGDGTTTTRLSPVLIMTSPAGWYDVSAGWEHNAAVTADRDLYTWGWNSDGQLGDGTTTNSLSPMKIWLPQWVRASAGWTHTVGLKMISRITRGVTMPMVR